MAIMDPIMVMASIVVVDGVTKNKVELLFASVACNNCDNGSCTWRLE